MYIMSKPFGYVDKRATKRGSNYRLRGYETLTHKDYGSDIPLYLESPDQKIVANVLGLLGLGATVRNAAKKAVAAVERADPTAVLAYEYIGPMIHFSSLAAIVMQDKNGSRIATIWERPL